MIAKVIFFSLMCGAESIMLARWQAKRAQRRYNKWKAKQS